MGPSRRRFLSNSHHPSFSLDPCWSLFPLGCSASLATPPNPRGWGAWPPWSGSTGKGGGFKREGNWAKLSPCGRVRSMLALRQEFQRESTMHYPPSTSSLAPASVPGKGIGNAPGVRSSSCKIKGGGVSISLPGLRRKNFPPGGGFLGACSSDTVGSQATGLPRVLQGFQICPVVPSQGPRMYCS